MLNATFSNISVISWWSVLLMEEIGVPGQTHPPVPSHWQTLSHNIVSSTPRHERALSSQRKSTTASGVTQIAIHETMSEQAQLYNTIVYSIYGACHVVLISFISSVIRWVANCKVSQFLASFNIVLPPCKKNTPLNGKFWCRLILAFFLQKRIVLFWCVKFWPFSFPVCLILKSYTEINLFLSEHVCTT